MLTTFSKTHRNTSVLFPQKCRLLHSLVLCGSCNTECGRNNSNILKVNKDQTKQGTQKILLFIKSTYDAFFFKHF